MCQQKFKGWLIGARMGKSQDQVGIQCILFQIYPSCNSVKGGTIGQDKDIVSFAGWTE